MILLYSSQEIHKTADRSTRHTRYDANDDDRNDRDIVSQDNGSVARVHIPTVLKIKPKRKALKIKLLMMIGGLP